MSVRVFCNECSAPLDDMPRIMIPHMIIVAQGGRMGESKSLHFCNEDGGDAKCMRSFLKKNLNRPMLVTGSPAGPAQ